MAEREKVEGSFKEFREATKEVIAESREGFAKLAEEFKDTKAGGKILGEDGKLGKDDFARMGEGFKESKVGKKLLGEDGKLGKDDFERMGEEFKESKVGKALLGEDGKFTGEDLKRIGGEVKETGEKAVNVVKKVVGKKEEE